MPNNLVKSVAKKTGKNVDEIEKLWSQAKAAADNEYKGLDKTDSGKYYAIVVSIFKKMAGIKEDYKEMEEDVDASTNLSTSNTAPGMQGLQYNKFSQMMRRKKTECEK